MGRKAAHTHPEKSLCEGPGKEGPLSPTVSLVCSTPVLRRREAKGEVSGAQPCTLGRIAPSTFFFELCLHCPVVLAYTSKYQEGLDRNKGGGTHLSLLCFVKELVKKKKKEIEREKGKRGSLVSLKKNPCSLTLKVTYLCKPSGG